MKSMDRLPGALRLPVMLGLGIMLALPPRGLAEPPPPEFTLPVITVQPVGQTVTNGAGVTLGVDATGADLSYQWLFNGIPIGAGNIITTVAGNYSLGGSYSGDGGAATNAGLNYAAGIAVDGGGNLYIADGFNQVIRKVDAGGIITTVAGNNNLGGGFSGDGGAATNATLSNPNAVAVDASGNLYIADLANNVIRKVDARGLITTVAGNPALGGGYSGDGGPATNAALNTPAGVAVDDTGDLFITDYYNHVVRKVDAHGLITTVAGNHRLGGSYAGDGGAATNAGLDRPNFPWVDGAGNLFFSEVGNNVVRKVDPRGLITTVAGNYALGGGYSGDGGPATNAALNWLGGVTGDSAGDLYLVEYGNNVVRRVDADGIITTVAGDYALGGAYSGDGGAATNAALNNPIGLALDGAGNLLIGDAHNNVVRKVAAAGFGVNPTNGTLTITNATPARSGSYQVIVSNPAGSVTSSIVSVVVDLPPVITTQPVSQTVIEGGSASFNVTAQGTPPVKYQWTLNGVKISGATGPELTLTNLHPAQAGAYAVKITTPAGSITSSNARLTVIAQTILVYDFTGQDNYIGDRQTTNNSYSGQLFFLPANTNGTFVGWGQIAGKKRYWVDSLNGGTLYTFAGAGNQTYTVLGQAGQNPGFSGSPILWSALYQGQNTQLPAGNRLAYSFPATFTGMVTEIYSDPNTGNLIRYESNATYTFAAHPTQTANNNGQTPADLINALIKTLTDQGYKN